MRRGYQVQAVIEVSGAASVNAEELALRRVERAGVLLASTDAIMADLTQDWSRPGGRQVLSMLFDPARLVLQREESRERKA